MANSPVFYCKNCGRPLKNPADVCPCVEEGAGFPAFRPPEKKKDEKKRRGRRKMKLFCNHIFAWESINRNQCAHKCVKCGKVKPGTAAEHDYEPVEGQCLMRCTRCGHEEEAGR